MAYKELDGIDYVLYYNDSLEKLHIADLSNKEQTDEHGYPWYKGCYGNCLIALQYQKITDRLYLLSGKTMKELRSEGFLKAETSRLHIKMLLNHKADKIIERDENNTRNYIIREK